VIIVMVGLIVNMMLCRFGWHRSRQATSKDVLQAAHCQRNII